MSFTVSEAYRDRNTEYLGLIRKNGWTIKQYAVTLPGNTFAENIFADGLALAIRELPSPPVTEQRPGLAFTIAHQGRAVNYLISCWWEQENELITLTFVNEKGRRDWFSGGKDHSFCVWDLQIMKAERDIYVQTILCKAGKPDIRPYLKSVLE